jgi:hypothetical protein
MNMNIVISQRFVSNLKFIYNYKKLSKYNIYGLFHKIIFNSFHSNTSMEHY